MMQKAEWGEMQVLTHGRCIQVDYNELIVDPSRIFSRIQSVGWPIDPKAAAATIDRKQKRHAA